MESEEEIEYRRREKFRSERPGVKPQPPHWRSSVIARGRPFKMTFKAFFLSTMDDSVSDEVAALKYSEYKQEFRRQQLNAFFSCNKDSEWFRMKYHPEERDRREKELLVRVQKRLEVFKELDTAGMIDISLQTENEDKLVRLLNTVVIKLEGGTDCHLQLLNMDSEKDIVTEGEEEPVKELHLTSSVFLRNVSPLLTKSELETTCQRYPGYLRLSLSAPDPTKKWTRKAWVTFERKAKIKEICFNLTSVRLQGKELDPVVNKDLSKRIRSVSSLFCDQNIARNDVKLAAKIITNLDTKNNLWINANNPLLSDVHDFLIDEVSAEEEELLRTTESEDSPVTERNLVRNEELLRVLDKLVLYLRIVHSTDFYSSAQYPLEDEMPNRLGLLHVREREPEDSQLTRAQTEELIAQRENKLKLLTEPKKTLQEEEALKLGLKTESDEVEKFVSSNCQEISKDKWLCPLSGKKFKAPDFIRKHIFNKFSEQVEKVKEETEFYNNYIRDPLRPELPENPNKVILSQPKPSPIAVRRNEDFNDNEETGKTSGDGFTAVRKRSIHDRLGRTIRATQTVSDPRQIVDYSDVDTPGFPD